MAEFGWPGGDIPGDLEFRHEPPKPIVDSLRKSLAGDLPPVLEPTAQIHALFSKDGPAGGYRLSMTDGSWFIRVTSRWGQPDLERRLVQHLVDRGVAANPLAVAGAELTWERRRFRVDVRPLVLGRHFTGSFAELSSLASTLAACHRALAIFPGADQVRRAAVDRNRRLEEVRSILGRSLAAGDFKAFGEHAAWAAQHGEWLTTLVERYAPRLDERPDAQCIHGEIHPGNVIFEDNDGTAVLVDFEESAHVYAPPAWDLAWLVQRFCLRDGPSPSLLRQRLDAVTEAYGAPLPALPEMMRQAAWHSMVNIVSQYVFAHLLTPRSELEKFVHLEQQAVKYEGSV